MSNRMVSKVYKAKAGGPTRKAVLVYLADCLNEETNACFPSITTIAKATEFHRDAVINALKVLRKDGVVEVLKKGGPNNGSNRYAIHPEKLVVENDQGSRPQRPHSSPGLLDVVVQDDPNQNKNQNLTSRPTQPSAASGFNGTIPAVLEVSPGKEPKAGTAVEGSKAKRWTVVDIDRKTGGSIMGWK